MSAVAEGEGEIRFRTICNEIIKFANVPRLWAHSAARVEKFAATLFFALFPLRKHVFKFVAISWLVYQFYQGSLQIALENFTAGRQKEAGVFLLH